MSNTELLEKIVRGEELRSGRKWILLPRSRITKTEIYIVSLFVLYWCLVYPFRCAFDVWTGRYFDYIADVVFFIDFFFWFFVAYIGNDSIVSEPRKVAWHYLRTNLLLNLIATWPAICEYVAGHALGWVRILRLLRILKLYTVDVEVSTIELDVRFPYAAVRYCRFIVWILLQVHITACLWYYIGMLRVDSVDGSWITSASMNPPLLTDTVVSKYINSAYFITVASSTVGYGDIHAVEEGEVVFVSILIIVNILVACYILGNMAALATSADAAVAEYRYNMNTLSETMKRNRFPQALQNRLFDYFQLIQDKSALGTNMLEQLPRALKMEVADHLNRALIERSYLFEACDLRFLSALSMLMTPQIFTPKQSILHEDDVSREFYLIANGTVELLSSADRSYTAKAMGMDGKGMDVLPNRVLGRGEVVGELAFLFNIRQTQSARAASHCTLYSIDKDAYDKLCREYPSDADRVRKNALKGVVGESVQHGRNFRTIQAAIRRQEEEKLMRLCNAASTNDSEKCEELILSGLDVNAADYDGRTALHIAASEGHMRMVEFLLRQGAKISAQDRWQGTPLNDAIRHHHELLAMYLYDRGGVLYLKNAASELCHCASVNDLARLKMLIRCGIDVNTGDYDRRTAMHLAASEGKADAVQVLVDLFADANARDRWRLTPLDSAIHDKQMHVAKLLRSLGGKTSAELDRIEASAQNDVRIGPKLSRLAGAVLDNILTRDMSGTDWKQPRPALPAQRAIQSPPQSESGQDHVMPGVNGLPSHIPPSTPPPPPTSSADRRTSKSSFS